MTKVAISLPDEIAAFLDRMVARGRYPSRSRALAEAARLLQRQETEQVYERALAALSADEEKTDANAFGEREAEWPKY